MKIEQLHPDTLKAIERGHPWITKDKISSQFPRDQVFLEIIHPADKRVLGIFIHDPGHPKIVARFWSRFPIDFKLELKNRISRSIHKRTQKNYQRDNLYFIFGESDQLPGLFVQKLGQIILIQYQCFFWIDHLKIIIQSIEQALNWKSPPLFYTQPRLPGEKKIHPIFFDQGNQSFSHQTPYLLTENGIKFGIRFDLNHDIGWFTDMSSIRETITPMLKPEQKILNLFSYTGAFSLLALKHHCYVTSVDLSKNYMQWLTDNIGLNSFEANRHQAMVLDANKAIKQLLGLKNERFSLIICDPPSSFNEKGKKINALDFYQEQLGNLIELLAPNGKLIIFLNTHQVLKKKFKELIRDLIPKRDDIILDNELTMDQDCPMLENFPEGHYIKGLVIKKNNIKKSK